MTDQDEGSPEVPAPYAERAAMLALAAVFAVVALLAGLDLAADVAQGTTLRHVLLEGALVLCGLAGVAGMGVRIRTLSRRAHRLSRHADGLQARLDATRAEADRWRRDNAELVAGLGSAIDRQLERWGLTPAEKEVALLLLKGLSHKELADVRGVAEATVRQQARALYRKAGLSGRHDLAAFFLEDLLGPSAGERPPRAAPDGEAG